MNANFQPKVRKISLDKLIITPSGMFEPLSQSCVHKDCGNPIEDKVVSVYGLTKQWRLYSGPGNPMVVVECESYTRKESDKKGDR